MSGRSDERRTKVMMEPMEPRISPAEEGRPSRERPITALSALELTRKIATREVSARAVLEAHLDRVERFDPAINAVVTRDPDGARRAADAADAILSGGVAPEELPPLFGLPMTVKDSYATADMRTTFAMPRMLDHRPTNDAALVARLRSAGAIIFGKTNLPLGAFDWQCKHPSFGRTNNPWDLERTPGGSSGGSAASLAAGFSSLEIGSDVAGSIRVPAHFCGVVGLRPTEATLPDAGHAKIPGYRDTVKHLVVCGPMARSVADVRLLLETLRSVSPEAPRGDRPLACRRSSEMLRAAPGKLRVMWSSSWSGVPLDADTTRTLRTTVSALVAAGHTVVEAAPSALDPDEGTDVWGRILGYEMITAPSWLLRSPPMRLFYAMNPLRFVFGQGRFASALSAGFASSRAAYDRALQRRAELCDEMDRFLEQGDVWLTPNTSTPAFRHCTIGSRLEVDGTDLSYTECNAPWQVSIATYGHPCLSLPCGTSQTGLPIGLQLHGRRGSDFALLDVAETVEGLAERRPGRVADL